MHFSGVMTQTGRFPEHFVTQIASGALFAEVRMELWGPENRTMIFVGNWLSTAMKHGPLESEVERKVDCDGDYLQNVAG